MFKGNPIVAMQFCEECKRNRWANGKLNSVFISWKAGFIRLVFVSCLCGENREWKKKGSSNVYTHFERFSPFYNVRTLRLILWHILLLKQHYFFIHCCSIFLRFSFLPLCDFSIVDTFSRKHQYNQLLPTKKNSHAHYVQMQRKYKRFFVVYPFSFQREWRENENETYRPGKKRSSKMISMKERSCWTSYLSISDRDRCRKANKKTEMKTWTWNVKWKTVKTSNCTNWIEKKKRGCLTFT